MKKHMFFSFLFALIFSFVFVACDNNRDDDTMDTDREVNDNTARTTDVDNVTFWDDDREFTYADRDSYRAEVNQSLERLNTQIAQLESRAANATGENKEDINERIVELKDRRDAVQNRMNTFADVTEDNWDNFKSEIGDAWDDIEDSYNQVVRDMDDNIDKNF